MLADLGKARLEFVERVVERLDLAAELVDAPGGVGLLLLQRVLQGAKNDGDFVDRVGIVLDQVLHDAHALVEAALHGGHLLLQLLDLGLQLNHFLAGARNRGYGQPKRGEQGEKCGESS